MRGTEPIKILHVVGGMNRGGTETWLMGMLRHSERTQFHFDFLVHTDQPCAYDEEIRTLGSRIIPCLHPEQPWRYAQSFRQILHTYGPYAVVHSHVHHYSGFVMRLARQAGVPVRIAHSHTTSPKQGQKLIRRLYFELMEQQIRANATVGLAVSRQAAEALFGSAWTIDSRWHVLYCGIDMAPFRKAVDPVSVRAQLHIPPDAFVIGHVGRFVEVKNHSFLLDIAAEIARREPLMHLLLIGDGNLRSQIEQRVAEVGLTNRVIFTGERSDIAQLLRGAVDVLVLPSLYEGLPITGIEAQAAGLPLFLSDVVTDELDEITLLVQRISLSESALTWAELILSKHHSMREVSQASAVAAMERSRFNVDTNIRQLNKIYAA